MLKKTLEIIFYPLKLFFYLLIYIYKICISPLIPHACMYYPSCSTYFVQALKKHGLFIGSYLGTKRILKCTPNRKGGVDLVPINLKGEEKWLF